MDYEFFFNKQMYNLIALYGFLFVFFAGMYYGYTFQQNNTFFNHNVTEIKYLDYINNRFIYTTENKEILSNKQKYGDYLAQRITTITIILTILGVLFLEIGYRNSSKYKYDKPLKQRLKEFYNRIKEDAE